jgi:hypothetical protein
MLGLRAVAVMLAAFALAGCSIIRAQPPPVTQTGTLQGIVTGPNGPIANAAVVLIASDATQHSALSDGAGYYTIASVPVGPASLSVRANGFTEYDATITIVSDPAANRQDVNLNPQ